MLLILTPPPKVMVILKEISFNCGSPVYTTCSTAKEICSRSLSLVCISIMELYCGENIYLPIYQFRKAVPEYRHGVIGFQLQVVGQ